ncbi:hypothetical protein [Anaerobaca lacustris]|uniref:Uncharacterized protein n=1 Tax=Anaerobaca lacustris TaxID=3044600 RepID=A0AAW6TT47_9BACT|nr:hypothetical protein [Sedimentisphaerales bacterium M17dextr]
MSPGANLVPMVMVPLTFVFVLLIILVAKAPKAGAWVVGGLLLLAPVALLRLAAAGSMSHPEAVPLFVVPATFLFVLLVILTAKAPKVGIALIVAIVVMLVLGFFVMMPVVSHRSVRAVTAVAQPVAPAPPQAPSPIWSEGVEHQFEADIYPSAPAAAEALGRRLVGPIQTVAAEPNVPARIVLFQEGNDRQVISALQRVLQRELSAVPCSVEADLRNIHPGEVGLTLRAEARVQEEVPRDRGTLTIFEQVMGGRITGTVFTEDRRASAGADYIDKPWAGNFSSFVAGKPDGHFLIARSREACTSENEARQQAIRDACDQLSAIAGQRWTPVPGRPPLTVSSHDVQEGGFILDQFVQSFDGSAGKIWRQAVLIDASADKLAWLNDRKNAEMRVERVTWAGMILSALGVLIVIVATYLFLNMATRGYYVWSLRIAGIVLAIAAIVSILLVLR